MLKKLMVTTALTGLVIGAAVAEGTPPAPSSPSAAGRAIVAACDAAGQGA